MIVSLIAAVSKNNVIGRNEAIPWKIPGEQIRFKELTKGKYIIMGRLTFEAIGKPLSERKTIIISKTQDITADHCVTVRSLEEAFHLVKNEEEVFIAGGGQIYKEALPYAKKLYLTIIDRDIEGNVYFPDFPKDEFYITYEEKKDAAIPYTYYTFERKEI